MFDGKTVLITGGSGSLGKALTKKILETNVKAVRIFSRNESKQIEMQNTINDSRVRFLIGDVRDLDRLELAMENVNIVIHAAALKHVPIVEYNPFEAIKTNVLGTQNVIYACLKENVETAICIGTDKAVAPYNTYGSTKHLMERLFVTASNYSNPEQHKTRFICVRYGNVLGSSGSVIPKFIEQAKTGKPISITDPTMTRFNITMGEAIELIFKAIKNGHGGEVFIPKLKAYKLGILKDVIVDYFNSKSAIIQIPVRPGEKYHESLISEDELRNTFENDENYVIIDASEYHNKSKQLKNLTPANLTEKYSSDKVDILTKEELKEILSSEGFFNDN